MLKQALIVSALSGALILAGGCVLAADQERIPQRGVTLPDAPPARGGGIGRGGAVAPVADAQAAVEDHRQLATMPEKARTIMRTDMQDHLVALNEIFGYLAENNLAAVSETAENRLGNSSMGRHAVMARGQGPGRFMPEAMRQLGWGMHDAASEFAQVVKEGDAARTYTALQKVTSSCVACHMSFRTR
ncbi:MAG: cytochrome c [Sulfuritalea sp.]|nr:cytochrome c [Sulfuritalea sp.]